jgi:carboxylesterase type B
VFGTNEHEMTTLLASVQLGAPLTASAYHAAVVSTVGSDHALDVETIYAGDAIISYNRALLSITSDLFFHCRVRRSARAAVQAQSEPVWRYLYSHSIENGSAAGVPAKSFGAGHGLELLVLFDDHHDHSQSIWWDPTPGEAQLTQEMERAWTSFARTGSTTPIGPVAWDRYDAQSDNYVVLEDPPSAASKLNESKCDFWDGIDSP